MSGRKYLFKISDVPANQGGADFPVQLMICPQDYFIENGCQYDGHLSDELRDAGLLPDDFDEIAESAFAVCSSRTLEEVTQDLLARGYIQDEEYNNSA